MVAEGTVPCPLSGCTERRHEIRTDRSGNPYIACRSWKNSVWLNRGLGTEWMKRNNGGSIIRANPDESDYDDEPLPTRPANPDFEPTVDAEFACGRCATVDRVSVPIPPGPSQWPPCPETA